MPLPLTISCSSKSRLALTFLVLPFWYLLTQVVPDMLQKSRGTAVCAIVISPCELSHCDAYYMLQQMQQNVLHGHRPQPLVSTVVSLSTCEHLQQPFNGPLSRTTLVCQYQKPAMPYFTSSRCKVGVWVPKNWKFYWNFYQLPNGNATEGRIPCKIFTHNL